MSAAGGISQDLFVSLSFKYTHLGTGPYLGDLKEALKICLPNSLILEVEVEARRSSMACSRSHSFPSVAPGPEPRSIFYLGPFTAPTSWVPCGREEELEERRGKKGAAPSISQFNFKNLFYSIWKMNTNPWVLGGGRMGRKKREQK